MFNQLIITNNTHTKDTHTEESPKNSSSSSLCLEGDDRPMMVCVVMVCVCDGVCVCGDGVCLRVR